MKKQSEISCCYCSSASFFECAPHLYTWILIGWQLLRSDQQEDPHTPLHSSCRAHGYTFMITALIQSRIHVFITSRGLASNLRFSSSGDGSSVLHQENKDEDHLWAWHLSDISSNQIWSTFVLYFVSVLSPQKDNCTFDVNQSDMTASNHIQKQFWSERACWWTL